MHFVVLWCVWEATRYLIKQSFTSANDWWENLCVLERACCNQVLHSAHLLLQLVFMSTDENRRLPRIYRLQPKDMRRPIKWVNHDCLRAWLWAPMCQKLTVRDHCWSEASKQSELELCWQLRAESWARVIPLSSLRPQLVNIEVLTRFITDQKMASRWRKANHTNVLQERRADLADLIKLAIDVQFVHSNLHHVLSSYCLSHLIVNSDRLAICPSSHRAFTCQTKWWLCNVVVSPVSLCLILFSHATTHEVVLLDYFI